MEPWLMAWIVAVLIVVLIHYLTVRDDPFETFFVGFATTIGTGVIIGLVFLGVVVSEREYDSKDIQSGLCELHTTQQSIVSVGRDNIMTGSFFLGTGMIGSRMYYISYIKTPNGLYLKKYLTNKTYIVEQEGTPKVVITNSECSMPWYSLMRGKDMVARHSNVGFTFHVPIGTVLREFKL